jgi:SAM-dependent methyltransferase
MSEKATMDNPFFARFWTFMSSHEPESMRALRREILAGLTGRVLEVGAGTGTNFVMYPAAVEEVVAVEPEQRLAALARQSATTAPVPVTVITATVETLGPADPFDAVVCSMVLCSIDEPEDVLRQLFSRLRPGGELRYLEHVASSGARGRLQQLVDATVWPRFFGNCHTHRDTERALVDAGFRPQTARREWQFPIWVPMPVSELALGSVVRPAAG